MRVFKTKAFDRIARTEKLADAGLLDAVQRAEQGIIDAQLGRFLIKQRVARKGGGKSGGFRVVAFFRDKDKIVFLHLFAKSAKTNLEPAELTLYRDLAKAIATVTWTEIAALIRDKGWIEIDEEP